MIKIVKKFKFSLMSSFLGVLVYPLFPYFLISNSHLPGSLKKIILRQTLKKYFRFLISIYVFQLQLFPSIPAGKC